MLSDLISSHHIGQEPLLPDPWRLEKQAGEAGRQVVRLRGTALCASIALHCTAILWCQMDKHRLWRLNWRFPGLTSLGPSTQWCPGTYMGYCCPICVLHICVQVLTSGLSDIIKRRAQV